MDIRSGDATDYLRRMQERRRRRASSRSASEASDAGEYRASHQHQHLFTSAQTIDNSDYYMNDPIRDEPGFRAAGPDPVRIVDDSELSDPGPPDVSTDSEIDRQVRDAMGRSDMELPGRSRGGAESDGMGDDDPCWLCRYRNDSESGASARTAVRVIDDIYSAGVTARKTPNQLAREMHGAWKELVYIPDRKAGRRPVWYTPESFKRHIVDDHAPNAVLEFETLANKVYKTINRHLDGMRTIKRVRVGSEASMCGDEDDESGPIHPQDATTLVKLLSQYRGLRTTDMTRIARTTAEQKMASDLRDAQGTAFPYHRFHSVAPAESAAGDRALRAADRFDE